MRGANWLGSVSLGSVSLGSAPPAVVVTETPHLLYLRRYGEPGCINQVPVWSTRESEPWSLSYVFGARDDGGMTGVPRQSRAIPDPEQDRLGEVLEDLHRVETFARERGDLDRAELLRQMRVAYYMEQQRRKREQG